MAKISTVFIETEDFDSAEKLALSVLAKGMGVLGQDHPQAIISMSNLAMIYKGQGRKEDAASIMFEAIEKSSRQLGKEPPSTLINFYNLALIRWEQGQQGQAKEIWTSVLPNMKAVLGAKHCLSVRCEKYPVQMDKSIKP
ncbi:hypothetical protein LX32DRAFT_606289 [Colletotrichum zoysiae]|uniref:Kinesin light chain n=1 Tax=Colletotrichum zoysiae TaxID=1216348 RepID=A0AAD9H1X4_9PEZI|nr:hypothetical protein LX32DRAFT_606289 [Colletotrichum zoysiae]